MDLVEKINSQRIPETQKVQAALQAQADLFRGSLFLTAKHLLGYKDVNWETHETMIRALEAESRRKLIVMPRGTFKSSLGSVSYPIWSLMRNPNLRILIDSEVYTNSANFLREIKQHLVGEKITELFGAWRNDGLWNEGNILIKQRSRVLKEASITASGIGAEKTSQHYDLIIADDMNSPKNSRTPEGCHRVIEHYKYYTSLLEPDGTIVLIGTRYSELDLIGWVIANEIERPKGLIVG